METPGRAGSRILLVCLLLGLLGARPGLGRDEADEDQATLSLRGVVVSRDGRPQSDVKLVCRRALQHLGTTCTAADGTFEFDRLTPGGVRLEAMLLGVPEEGVHVRRGARAGDESVRFVVDVGDELVVRVEPAPVTRGEDATWAKLTLGTEPPFTPWSAPHRDGELRFRRIRKGQPWTLWIPWGEDLQGTALVSGTSSEPGRTTVELEPGRPIEGTVGGDLTPWFGGPTSGPPNYGVIARRGPAFARGHLDRDDGSFRLPPLPAGAWEVTAYNVEHERGHVLAVETVEAGGRVHLEPKPVSRSEWVEQVQRR
jgi:hypothetical protein